MQRDAVLKRIHEIGLIPVLRAESQAEALMIAQAIHAGGVPILEVTMTVPGALDVIATLTKEYGDQVLIGAGTVLDAETARATILNGAQFVVSPALDVATIAMCRKYSIAVMPGALTPTEVLTAWSAGADAVKIFPASAVGGAAYLKALKGPFPQIPLVPTGGVSLATAAEFISAGAFAIGVGGDLVDNKAAREGNSAKITDNARRYLELVSTSRSKYVSSDAKK